MSMQAGTERFELGPGKERLLPGALLAVQPGQETQKRERQIFAGQVMGQLREVEGAGEVPGVGQVFDVGGELAVEIRPIPNGGHDDPPEEDVLVVVDVRPIPDLLDHRRP